MFSLAIISAATNEVIIGHYTERSGMQVDASVIRTIEAGKDYNLEITLKGTTVSVVLDGQTILGYDAAVLETAHCISGLSAILKEIQ